MCMEIVFINGSPKPGNSTSEYIIGLLVRQVADGNITRVYNISKDNLKEKQFKRIQDCDVLVLAFPLYVDSIPSHMLRFLAKLEDMGGFSKNTMVYCFLNNGFFEGSQNDIAVSQIKNWCNKSGLSWGMACGAGEMLPFIKDVPMGHGPNKNIWKAVQCLSANIMEKRTGDNMYFSPCWPKWLWKIQASFYMWYPRARTNKLLKRDLYRRINTY